MSEKEKKDNQFLFMQTAMIVGIQLAINMANGIFDFTSPQDKGVISTIKITLVKLKKSFTSKLKEGFEEYEGYLETSSQFFQNMVLLAFGVSTYERTVCLFYLSKIVSWLNAKRRGEKNNFLFVDFDIENNNHEVNINGEYVSVISCGVPSDSELVLLFDEGSTYLAIYNFNNNIFLTGDHKNVEIIPQKGMRWLSVTELTKTL